ncbi:MAG: hypothetical protein J4F28_02015 [Nitrosopumilaceae archaeon]|nr:hypothetical protein [Nitrosopumilaceae archaeon]
MPGLPTREQINRIQAVIDKQSDTTNLRGSLGRICDEYAAIKQVEVLQRICGRAHKRTMVDEVIVDILDEMEEVLQHQGHLSIGEIYGRASS